MPRSSKEVVSGQASAVSFHRPLAFNTHPSSHSQNPSEVKVQPRHCCVQ